MRAGLAAAAVVLTAAALMTSCTTAPLSDITRQLTEETR
jgi:hypothetical protein